MRYSLLAILLVVVAGVQGMQPAHSGQYDIKQDGKTWHVPYCERTEVNIVTNMYPTQCEQR